MTARQAAARMDPDRNVRSTTWLVGVLVFVASAVTFLPLLDAGFVNWDDDKNFVQNPAYRGLSWEHLKWMFTTFHYGGYHPLSWLSVAIDHAIWGMDPRGYHLTNLLLHALNAVLLFRLFVELADIRTGQVTRATIWTAGAGAVLFAVHPLRVEPVAWITERRGLLAALFLILSVQLYLRAHRRDRAQRSVRRLMMLSVAMYSCSLLSKGLAMVLPVVLLVLDVYPLSRFGSGRSRGRLLLEKVPYVVIAVVVGVFARLAQAEGGAVYSWNEYSLPARIAQAAYSACFYLWRTAVPADLAVLHPLQQEPSWAEPRFFVSAAVVALVTVVLVVRRRRWPWLLTTWIAYGVLLAPVSGLAQAGPSLVAERYSYLPLAPFAGLGAAALLALWQRRSTAVTRAVIVGTAVVVTSVWAAMSRAQCLVWHDSVTLWSRSVEVHPGSVFAQVNLGSALSEQARHADAAARYEEATRLMPSLGSGWYGLGLSRFRAGDAAAALAAFERARDLIAGGYWTSRPEDAELFYMLALTTHTLERYADAETYCRRALAADRAYVHAYPLLADALARAGDRQQAIRVLEEALSIAPGREDLRSQLEQLRR